MFQLGDAEMLDDNGHARLPRIMAVLNITTDPVQESRRDESFARKPYET